MYNLLEYRDIFSMTSKHLWDYYRGEVNDEANEIVTKSKYFEYKTKIIARTAANTCVLKKNVFVPLKYLSNFWRSVDLPLINYETELDLAWSKDCILSETLNNAKVPDNPIANPAIARLSEGSNSNATFKLNSTKIYVPVATLFINDSIKFLENIKQGFKRTLSWNKYRSEITAQPKKSNLDYMIDPTIMNII